MNRYEVPTDDSVTDSLSDAMTESEAKVAEAKEQLKAVRSRRKEMLQRIMDTSTDALLPGSLELATKNLELVRAEVRRVKAWHRREDKRIANEFERMVAETSVPEGKIPVHIHLMEDAETGAECALYLIPSHDAAKPPLPEGTHVIRNGQLTNSLHLSQQDGGEATEGSSELPRSDNAIYFYHRIKVRTVPSSSAME